MILIVSRDKDFSAALAEQVARELKLDCRQAETIENTQSFLDEATLIIADEEIKASAPILSLAGKKPLRLAQLLSDIKKATQKPAGNKNIALGKTYHFSPRQKQLHHAPSKKSVGLTDKEMQLLQLMAGAGKAGVAKEELLKTVWGMGEALNTHTLETHIYRLRGKFRELSGRDVIEAVASGYRIAV